jgi:hypothetical protein
MLPPSLSLSAASTTQTVLAEKAQIQRQLEPGEAAPMTTARSPTRSGYL